MAWSKDIERTSEALFAKHYDDLVGLARALRRANQVSNTLLTGDLLHEAFLRLRNSVEFEDDQHFKSSVALAMRHVAVDRARSRLAQKRGGGEQRVEMDHALDVAANEDVEAELTLAMHQLMRELEAIEPRQARVVDCRFFAGFSTAETAELICVDETTVRRDWKRAQGWFRDRLHAG